MHRPFIYIFLLFSTSLCFAKTGYYSAAFDPPTVDEIEFIRDSFQELNLDRLVLMVERLSPKGFDSSAKERLEMVKCGLEDLKDKVEFVIEPWSGKEAYQKKENFQILNCERKRGEKIPEAIAEKIQKEGLYPDLCPLLTRLKQSLFQETFQAYLRQISLLFPADNINDTPLPQFSPKTSHLGWVDQFISSVLREKHLTNDTAEAFGLKSEKLLISSIRGKPYAKLHFLHPTSIHPSAKVIASISTFKLPSISKDEKHTFNVETYCSDRFPKALFTSNLFSEKETYFHRGSSHEALTFHHNEGFTEIYEIASQAVRKLREYHLVRNPNTSKFRFIVSNIFGKDTLDHIALQFNYTSGFDQVNLVSHLNDSLLFDCECKFRPSDTLIIGFKNAIVRRLEKTGEWVKCFSSSSGLEMDLFENIKTHERVVLSKCVYGDQLTGLLNYFYEKGIRQFQYFGTAGSLSSDIHIGDVILPHAFSIPENRVISFQNAASTLLSGMNDKRIKEVKLHGWTKSPVLETENFLKSLQKAGNQTIDVEGRYYGEFFINHKKASSSMVLFISDEPFGEINIDDYNALDHYVDEAFDLVIPFFDLGDRVETLLEPSAQ